MSTNFAAHAEKIARHYWGEPNPKLSNAKQIRWGNNGSKSLDLLKGVWVDHEEGHGGPMTKLVSMNSKRTLMGNIADVLERDFGIPKNQHKALEPRGRYVERVYEYYDIDGSLAYQIERMQPKGFRQRRPDPDRPHHWIYNMQGVDPLPYNLVGIMERPEDPVFIVEGEKCAQRLIDLGLVATTNHGGSKNWSSELSQYLVERNCVVLPDNDAAGYAHADKVVRSIWDKAGAIKTITLDGLPEKGDVVDWLFAGNTVTDLMEVVRATPKMKRPPEAPDEAVEVEEEQDDGAVKPYKLLDQDAVWSMPPVEFLVDGLIPERSFAMIYGAPGSGKSFLAIDMALSVAHGVDWHGMPVKKGAVLYIAGEGIGGFSKRWKAWSSKHGLTDKPEMYLLPTAVNMMDEEEVERLCVTVEGLGRQWAMVIVDTVARSIAGADENAAQSIGMFVQACDKVREIAGGTMLAVHHSGKDSTRGARGSNALLGALDTSILAAKLDDTLTINVQKQKDAEPIDDISFNMVSVPVGIADTSVVLERTDAPAKAAKRKKPLAVSQERALKSLRNLCADRGPRVAITEWHNAHVRDCPDTHPSTRNTARDALVDNGYVVLAEGLCWINKDLEE